MKKWNERRFLYINDELHRKLKINKSKDIYTAQNTRTGEVRTYSYFVVRETHKMAYNTREVGEMLGRTPDRIRALISKGVVDPQKQSYNHFTGIQEFKTRPNVKTTHTGRCEYYFKPEEVHMLRDHIELTASNNRVVPSKAQLEALMDQSVVLYVKKGDGTFVPTWKAKEY